MKNDGLINASWGQTVYLDTDQNPATGYQHDLPLGADRVLQGRYLYQYTGTGIDWNWKFVTEVAGTAANGNFEYSFPRWALGNSEHITLAFVGSNEPYGGSIDDLYPDGVYDTSSTARTLTYTATAPANSTPRARNLELITTVDQPIELALVASDADNDALTYTILQHPQHGTVSGTAPALAYQPDSGYTGTDSFTYRVSDAQAQSRIATVTVLTQSLQESKAPGNPVAQMSIDGNLAEWQSLLYFKDDPNDVSGGQNPADYLRAAMAHDSQYFYLTFSNDGQDLNMLQDWLFTVYLDTDMDPATGYKSGLAIGADLLLQGSAVFSYNGAGHDWAWSALGTVNRSAAGSNVEVGIPRQAIGDPDSLRLVLIGDNYSAGGYVEDVYPDGSYDPGSAIRYLAYTAADIPSEPVAMVAPDESIVPVSGRQTLMQYPTQLTRQSQPDAGRKSTTTGSGALAPGTLLGGLSLAGLAGYRRRSVKNSRTVAIHG